MNYFKSKSLVIFSLFTLSFFSLNAKAEYSFFDDFGIEGGEKVKEERIFDKTRTKRGFTFTLAFEKIRGTKPSINSVDVLVKYFKRLFLDKYGSEYKDLFKEYKVVSDEGDNYLYVKFYAFPPYEDIKELMRFLDEELSRKNNNNLSYERIYDKIGKASVLDSDNFKKYIRRYKEILEFKLRKFYEKVKTCYGKGAFEKMYEIFCNFSCDVARTDDLPSVFLQNRNIKKHIENIKNLLLRINKKNFKKKDLDDDFEFGKDSFDDDFFEGNFFEVKSSFSSNNLGSCLGSFFKLCDKHCQNLSSITHADFSESLKSVDYKYEKTHKISKKISKFKGTIETIAGE